MREAIRGPQLGRSGRRVPQLEVVASGARDRKHQWRAVGGREPKLVVGDEGGQGEQGAPLHAIDRAILSAAGRSVQAAVRRAQHGANARGVWRCKSGLRASRCARCCDALAAPISASLRRVAHVRAVVGASSWAPTDRAVTSATSANRAPIIQA